jgi:uncharacterized protein involved in cysteine biosynthesis
MAALRPEISALRRRSGDVLLVIGCVFIAMALVPQGLLSVIVSVCTGALLIAISHIAYPFQDQLARFRGAPTIEPSRELKAQEHANPKSKDAI